MEHSGLMKAEADKWQLKWDNILIHLLNTLEVIADHQLE